MEQTNYQIPPTGQPQPAPTDRIHEVAETLNIHLPEDTRTPLLDGMIALLSSIGGISILAGIVADIFQPDHVSLHSLLWQIITGIVMITVGYGILTRKGWTVWLYGAISLSSLFFNPVLAIMPLLIVSYLYSRKIYFDRNAPKEILLKLIQTMSGNGERHISHDN